MPTAAARDTGKWQDMMTNGGDSDSYSDSGGAVVCCLSFARVRRLRCRERHTLREKCWQLVYRPSLPPLERELVFVDS